MDLFNYSKDPNLPLAERLRPRNLEEFVGQAHVITKKNPIIRNFVEAQWIPNLILWGPPGSGKTSFAHVLSSSLEAHFLNVNAIDTGAKRLREIGKEAHERKIQFQTETVLFIDEIHRLNKAQQDVLLPYTEQRDIVLVGATTENPSYELNSALLSRCQVLVFSQHSTEDLKGILNNGCSALEISTDTLLDAEAQSELVLMAMGDARKVLNYLEGLFFSFQRDGKGGEWPLDKARLHQMLNASQINYDKGGDEHYNCISAYIKSIRGGDPDAAVYYLARMLEGGEDPSFIARRLIVLASEDVGNADPRGLTMAVSGLQAVQCVGMPEARINLSQVTTYLASAPKSNRAYMAYNKAQKIVKERGALEVPKHLKSAPTSFLKKIGFGKEYVYSQDTPTGWADQEYLPESIKHLRFYEPLERGFEKKIKEYLAWMKQESKETDESSSSDST